VTAPIRLSQARASLTHGSLQSCPVDLRPFVVQSPNGAVQLLNPALTRVAMPAGSLIVNATQGEGSKTLGS